LDSLIPFITIEHSGYDPFHGSVDYKKMYSYVAMKADKFIFPSHHIMKEVGKIYEITNPIVIHNGGVIPKEKVDFDLREKLKFISVGALSDYKNYGTLIRAFNDKVLRERSTLKIIGDGPLKNKYQTIISNLKLENVVYLLGPMKHEKVFEMLDKSDVFVILSKEPFCVAAAEALGRGLPVVVAETTGIKEIIKDGIQGFVVKDEDRMNPNLVGQVLRRFVEKPELIPKMSKEAFELSKNFTWETNAKKMYDVLLAITKDR
jgi:glycosyltransferase involved in cell wall biosynthesis